MAAFCSVEKKQAAPSLSLCKLQARPVLIKLELPSSVMVAISLQINQKSISISYVVSFRTFLFRDYLYELINFVSVWIFF